MHLLVPPPHKGENNRVYACRVLRMNIMTLRLQPGEPLNEAELAARLQMSRTPVHEAITTLRNEWLGEIFPQRGTQVSRIDPALVKEGYSTRLLLESALLRDVAGKIGRTQVQQLLDCMRQQEALRDRMPDAVDEFIQLDDEFHRMMYFFGGRSHTWLAIRGLVSHYDRMRYLDALDGECDYDRVTVQHRDFCDYLLMGLPDGVDPEQTIGAHLTSFRGNLMAKMALHPDYFTLQSS
ncbi:GntR family transcriptional regulator [uncultured Subdoligranulum sp.]|uniref:GntR family transcriptional regulator n=1 Tax=uncultured Subdoligranulum sp. TaxID=512298 RepID=UPI0026382DB8|nr:GntR family transcriptional regulator [uncultured Subdoligranulum sp.]